MNEKLKKLSDLSNVKVGDTLWHFMLGDVVVKGIYTFSDKPYVMDVESNGKEHTLNLEWLRGERLLPALFLKNPFTEEPSFKERWMMVSNNGEDWWRRRVFMVKNGKYFAWCTATNDVTADVELDYVVWNLAKELPQTIELTKGEVAERLGIDVELIIIKQ